MSTHIILLLIRPLVFVLVLSNVVVVLLGYLRPLRVGALFN